MNKKNQKMTLARIPRKTLDRLIKQKIMPREPYYSVIDRLLDETESKGEN